MDIITGSYLSSLGEDDKRFFQGLLPEIIKRLILNTCGVDYIRVPSGDDIWAPGFDGIVENSRETQFVCSGESVWEIGTNKDSLKKINEDYKKRTDNALGINKSETVFYLITPNIWAYDESIQQWESEHKDDWKNVRVYDAAILADWINSEPAVCAWLIEQINTTTKEIRFSTVQCAWSRFASKTLPPFTNALFLGGRDEEKAALLACWENPIIRVKAETTFDAYGFCLSTILEEKEKANSVIVIDNEDTYTELSRLCKGKVFLLNFMPKSCDVIQGNRVILCYNKEDTIKVDVKLNPISKSLFETAMCDMGMSLSKAQALYRQTHGGLLPLIRRIPGTSTESRPRWANQDQIELIAPLMLLRSFNSSSEDDKRLVAYLADENYNIISKKYEAWLRLEDSPVKQVSNHFVIVSFEEAWTVLQLNPSSQMFQRLFDCIKTVFFADFGKETELSGLETSAKKYYRQLVFDVIHFAEEDQEGIVEKRIRNLMEEFPSSAEWWEYLYLFAAATPSAVMDYIKNDSSLPDSFIMHSFDDVKYNNKYCKVLEALDELVLHEETKIVACNILFNLCLHTRDKKFFWGNTPRESLLNVLCLWSGHTVLSLREKMELIRKFFSKDKEYTASFATDLLFKDTAIYGIRDEANKSPEMPVYLKEYYEGVDEITQILFEYYIGKHDLDQLKELLNGCFKLNPSTIIGASDQFHSSDYSLEELIPFNYELRKRGALLKKNNNNEKKDKWIQSIEKWIDVTTPSDEIGKIGWLFYDSYAFFVQEIPADRQFDLVLCRETLEKKRTQVLEEFIQTHQFDEIIKLVRCSSDEKEMGDFFARYLQTELFFCFIKEAKRLKKLLFLCGLAEAAKKENCIIVLDSLNTEERQVVLSNLFRRDISEWLDTPEKEQLFWNHQHMTEYDETTHNMLMKYNPCGLLFYYANNQKGPISLVIDRIIVIIKAIITAKNMTYNNFSFLLGKMYMAETESKTEYRRMGGSYYSATVDVIDVIGDQLRLPEGVTPITCHSPIGKALLHKRVGDTVNVRTPDNGSMQYKVLMVR